MKKEEFGERSLEERGGDVQRGGVRALRGGGFNRKKRSGHG